MSQPEKRVPVYHRGESRRAPAKAFIPMAQADELFETGMAEWSKNGKSLILKKTAGEVKLRDESCQMGQRIMDKLIFEPDEKVRAIVEAWRPTACWN